MFRMYLGFEIDIKKIYKLKYGRDCRMYGNEIIFEGREDEEYEDDLFEWFMERHKGTIKGTNIRFDSDYDCSGNNHPRTYCVGQCIYNSYNEKEFPSLLDINKLNHLSPNVSFALTTILRELDIVRPDFPRIIPIYSYS